MRLETRFDLRHRQRYARGDIGRHSCLLNDHLLEPALSHVLPGGRPGVIYMGIVRLRLRAGGEAKAGRGGQCDDD